MRALVLIIEVITANSNHQAVDENTEQYRLKCVLNLVALYSIAVLLLQEVKGDTTMHNTKQFFEALIIPFRFIIGEITSSSGNVGYKLICRRFKCIGVQQIQCI